MFIACQSPLPTTVNEFWNMIVEQRVEVIVMLVKVEKRKCEQYWPEVGSPIGIRDDSFVVETQSSSVVGDFIRRVIKITDFKYGGNSHIVTHWQYLSWPDHGAPSDTAPILSLITQQLLQKIGNAPVVVHCSAGAGRTGTFCTLLTCLALGIVDMEGVAEVIARFKYQRSKIFTVETDEQYDFITKALNL